MEGKIVCLLSCPRLAWTDHLFCLLRALVPLGIILEKHSGAYWYQSITKLMEDHVNDGTDYILTVDYDTWFGEQDVRELYRLLTANERIHAVCGVQVKRGRDSLIGSIADSARGRIREVLNDDLNADLTQILTGHFGLTMLRVDALRRVEKPWFMSTPDPIGSWGEDKIDEDINFWLRWSKAKNTLFMANKVKLGHIQAMVTFPGNGDHQPVHRYVQQLEEELQA